MNDNHRWPLGSVLFAGLLFISGIILTVHIMLIPDALFDRIDKRIGIIGGWIGGAAAFLGISFGFGGLRQFFASTPVRVCIGITFALCLVVLLPIGAVTIDSAPAGGAAVRLGNDTEPRGRTPAKISWLSIRPYKVELTLDGYSKTIRKVPFDSVLLHKDMVVGLDRLTGTIAVTTDPAGAAVFVDDEKTAHRPTPVTIEGVATGPHRLAIARSGYALVRLTDVNVEDSKVTTVDEKLERIGETYSLRVHSKPPGAGIFIRGKLYGNAPLAIQLFEGEHLIEARINSLRKEKAVSIPRQNTVAFIFE